jgi:hypothetical protein
MARVASASVNAGATLNQDVNVGGSEFLTVLVQVGNSGSAAGAAGDSSVTVQQYVDPASGQTPVLAPINIPTLETSAAVLVGSTAYVWARYRVSGISRVQIQAKNNNAAAKPVEIDYDLG